MKTKLDLLLFCLHLHSNNPAKPERCRTEPRTGFIEDLPDIRRERAGYSTRTGVWHTINGRSMMHPDELTLAEVFQANGYATAMIGKWHLGDNYPCRPEDQGFDHAIWHQGGGVDNAPDYWGNDYFDDTYKVNGAWQKFEGYCTDVWFREAIIGRPVD